MVLTLYKLDASPPVRSVLMVIEALGLSDVEYVDVNIFEGANKTKEYLKMNPQHTVPVLVDDDFSVWDSHAISVYLICKYGSDDALYPADFKKRAIIDQRLHFDTGILFPSLRGALEPILLQKKEKTFRQENLDRIRNAYDLTENILSSTYMAGDSITLADICCAASVSSLNEVVPIDTNAYPKLTAWLERVSQEDFYKKRNVPGLLQLREAIKMNVTM